MSRQTHSASFAPPPGCVRLHRVALALLGVLLLVNLGHAVAQFQEAWDDPGSINCWFYYGTQQMGQGETNTYPLTWCANGLGGGGGFVACELDRLTAYGTTGTNVFYPIFGYAESGCARHPDLRNHLLLRVYFDRTPAVPSPGSAGPGRFPGKLHLWVGHGDPIENPEDPYVFYALKEELPVPWCTDWTPSSVMLSTNIADWALLAESGNHQSLDILLSEPEQMGFVIVRPDNWKKAGPPTGWLGFDSLSFEPTPPAPSQTTWVVDGRPQAPDRNADFWTINEAVCDWRVRTGHTVEVVGGQEYAEIVFDPKGLLFHGKALEGVRPTLTTPLALVNPGAQNHVWLEAGGRFHRFILRGPGRTVGYKFSGFTFTNPSLLMACELTDYPTAACVAFCAANAIDSPSGIRYNVIARNDTGIANGDVEHIHFGNVVIYNRIGFDLIAGNSAQVLNNLIVSNVAGIYVSSYAPGWATYPEIANNTVCYNTFGVGMSWTPYPDENYDVRDLLMYYDPYLQATDDQVRASWRQYVQHNPSREPACPISAVIRDNIFAYNSAPAIHANTVYGPIRVGSNCQIDPTQGGCYAQIRNNLFFRNYLNYDGEDPNDKYRTSKHFEYDLPYPPPDNEKPRFKVPNPPGAPGYISGRMVQNLFGDPKWANDPPWSGAHPWTVKAEESPCIDAGSTTLDLGYGSQAYNGQLVYDRGALDLGFHHWRLMQPELVVTNVAGNRVSVYVQNIPTGMAVDVRATDDLSPGGTGWLLEIAVDPEKARRERGFWWLPDWPDLE